MINRQQAARQATDAQAASAASGDRAITHHHSSGWTEAGSGSLPLRQVAGSVHALSRSGRPGLDEGWWEPPTDIYFQGGDIIVRMEIPGVQPADVELIAEGRLLRIRGRRVRECPGPDCVYRQIEISYGPFQRLFEFPFTLTDAELHAGVIDGFLTVSVTPVRSQPRRITVATPTNGTHPVDADESDAGG